MHRLSHPLHDARQRGGLRKRQEERQLAGRQNRVRHPAGADYDDGRKLHVYPGFFRRRQLSDHRRAVVGSFADRARIGRRIRPHRARRIRRRGYPPALAFRATGHGSYYLVSKRNGLVVDLCNFQLADGSPLIAYPRNNGWNQQFHFDCAGTLDTDLSTLPEEADDSGESELLCADDGSSKPSAFSTSSKPSNPRFPSTR